MTRHNRVVDVLTHKANHLSYHEFKCLQLKGKIIKFKMHFEVFHILSSLYIQTKNCYKLKPEVTEPSKVSLLFAPHPFLNSTIVPQVKGASSALSSLTAGQVCKGKICSICFTPAEEATDPER